MANIEIKNTPLFVELPVDLRQWLDESRRRDGFTIKGKTIRIFKRARHLEQARQLDVEGAS